MASPDLQDLRILATLALLALLAFQVIFLVNYFYSIFKGARASDNPWQANTLEWVAASPPPHGNFKELPTVYRGPYEYSHPSRSEDFWPQNQPG
jgi:cytochrome c oxidase subunit 1